jgi:hypothetical protein
MKWIIAAQAIPWLIFGLIFFLLGVYLFVKRNLLKLGKDVKVKILKVIPNGEHQYVTYVSFYYGDELINEEILLERKLIEGRQYNGRYVNIGKENNLSIGSYGFYSSFAGEMILLSTGAFLIFLFFGFINENIMKYVYIALVAMLLIWLVCVLIIIKKKK